ncbi:hypothetical protein D3C81_1936120 [compost metagenome]
MKTKYTSSGTIINRWASDAANRVPIATFMAWPPPRSSQVIDRRSMVMVRITIGNSATDRPRSSPSLWLNRLMAAINTTTKVSTTERRGSICSLRCSR